LIVEPSEALKARLETSVPRGPFRLQLRLPTLLSESKTMRAFCGRLNAYWSVSPGTSIEPAMVCAASPESDADVSVFGERAARRPVSKPVPEA
jgi:hypothetical protein